MAGIRSRLAVEHERFLYNLSGSYHGFGDVVGPYLLAAEHARSGSEVHALVDERAEKVIRTYLELQSTELIFDTRLGRGVRFVQYNQLKTLPEMLGLIEAFYDARAVNYPYAIEPQLREKPDDTLIVQDMHSHGGMDSAGMKDQAKVFSELKTLNK